MVTRQPMNLHALLLTTLLTLLLLHIRPATSQFLNQGNLPQCGQGCPNLRDAQRLCIPPQAPSIQKSCFCESALLQQLNAAPAAVCSATCTTPDQQQQLQQWYTGFCRSNQQPGGTGNAQDGGNGNGAEASASATATEAGATSTGEPDQWTGYSREDSGSWWEEHSKWIAMVIVLIIGFSIIIALGIFFKKRHDKKRNAASQAPPPSGWGGPNSDPHLSFTGQEAGATGTFDAEKGEGVPAGAAAVGGGNNSTAMPQRSESAHQTPGAAGDGEPVRGGGVRPMAKGGAQKLKKLVSKR
ncbi:MAG: hypothetical protein M1831_002565 [Alyxoria varia]|nr:MAG: hypothetical protein M1831_002565 [Alyxoria varia]